MFSSQEKNLYVWCWILTTLTVEIISQYIHTLDHYVIHLKLINNVVCQLYLNKECLKRSQIITSVGEVAKKLESSYIDSEDVKWGSHSGK